LTTLRPYQQAGLQAIREAYGSGYRRVLYVLPTGSGKTVCFTYIARGIQAKGKRVLIVAHRRELLDQISGALRQWGVPHATLSGGSRGIPHTNVVVASVFTLVNRLKHWPPPDLVIGDEAHHFTVGSSWGTVVKAFPQAKVLGVTATPERLDGKGLGDVFDHMIVGPSVAELTAQGFLSPAEVYAPAKPNLAGVAKRGGDYVRSQLETAMDKPSITGDAIEHYLRLVPGRRAVAFCVSIQHAKDVAEQFRRAGVVSEHIDGSQDDALRAERIAAFRAGRVQVLTSCDLISEGFDLPSIECAILLRPTESLGLYMQQVGRAIRPAEGKDRTVILDHAGNTLRHGFIDEPRDWTLTEGAVKKRTSSETTVPIRMCPKCYAVHRPAPTCPRCGYEYKVGRVVEQRQGTLEQISSVEETMIAPDADMRRSYHQLVAVARKRNYPNPQRWAFSIVETQAAKRLAQQRDAPRQALINGLTASERQELWEQTIGRDQSQPEKYVPWGINGGG